MEGYMHTITLPFDYALVLRYVNQQGEEDFSTLAESLSFDRHRLAHIVQALQGKRLIKVTRTAHDALISVSTRGQRLLASIWPGPQTQSFAT